MLIVLITMTAPRVGNSQEFSVGARLGANLASQSALKQYTSGDFSRSVKAGLLVGLAGNLKLNDWLSVQTELLFTQKGVKYSITYPDDPGFPEYKQSRTLNDLEIPILVKGNLSLGSFILNGGLGPYFAIALGGTEKVTEPGDIKYDMEFGDGAYRRFDMGLAFGAGIGLEMGPGIISLDLRYDLGFVNIKNGPKAEDSKASCNRAFTIGLEYMIPLY